MGQNTNNETRATFLDKAIGFFSPEAWLRRQIARNRMQRMKDMQTTYQRSFDIISGGRLYTDISGTSQNITSIISDGSKALREYVRQLELNNGYASGPIKRLVNYVVGPGFTFQSRVKADRDDVQALKIKDLKPITADDALVWNFFAERGFKRWQAQADKALRWSFNELLRMAAAALFRDGEVLLIGRTSRRTDRFIPFCLDLLEIDRLQTPADKINEKSIRDGIEFDAEGVPKNYYILKQHPGDTYIPAGLKTTDFEIVPAFNDNGTRKVMHLFLPLRPEQIRGVTMFAAGLKALSNFDRYEEAEIMAALEDACMMGFVKSNNPQAWAEGMGEGNISADSNHTNNERISDFAPNKWTYLNTNEDVTVHRPQRPNENLVEVSEQILRNFANALDMPPEVLMQNWRDLNYSNARTIIINFYLSIYVLRKCLVDHACNPVYENALADMVFKGAMQPAWIYSYRKDEATDCEWIPPKREWLDPQNEAAATDQELKNNTESMSAVLAAKGKDFAEHMETVAQERQVVKRLEEKYGVSLAPEAKAQGAGPMAQGDKTKSENDTTASGEQKGGKKK